MLAVSCLQVAAKYEEAEENVPAVTQLSRASGMGLTIQTVQRWEVAVLEGLGWQLTCIVPLHFLDYYLTRGLLFQGEALRGLILPPLRPPAPSAAAAAAAGTGGSSGSSPASSRPSTPAGGISSNSSNGSNSKGPNGGGGGGPSAAAAQQLRKYAHFFAQHLAVHEFGGTGHLRPSFLAALVALLARTVVGVAPAWRPELAALTGYEEAQLLPLAQQVLRGYREAYPHHTVVHHGAALSSSASSQQHHQHHHQASGGGLTLGVFGVFGGGAAPQPLPAAGAAGAAGSGGGGGFAASLCIPDPPPFDYHWVGRGVTTAV